VAAATRNIAAAVFHHPSIPISVNSTTASPSRQIVIRFGRFSQCESGRSGESSGLEDPAGVGEFVNVIARRLARSR